MYRSGCFLDLKRSSIQKNGIDFKENVQVRMSIKDLVVRTEHFIIFDTITAMVLDAEEKTITIVDIIVLRKNNQKGNV